MNSTYELYYHQQEEQHWWFKARREIVFDLIRNMKLPKEAAILDVGCSGGPLLLALRAAGYEHLTGIDVSESGIELAQQRGLSNVSVMDGSRLDFADKSFDLLIASDVLEHIENEADALREWVRVLRPGGTLLLFVPAHSYLWSQHDEVNHHFRRYSASHLRSVLSGAGLQIERQSYWNNLLFFPTAVFRLVQRQLLKRSGPSPVADFQHFPAILNKSVLRLLRLENKLLQHVNLPVGVSLFAVAHKAK
ncbi:MAG TPA: class I SAM-dependent methyltransferase [Hymenobacter sp.]|jgi:ubiquinone/menaquinone biosynthesis C-methylase UbiE